MEKDESGDSTKQMINELAYHVGYTQGFLVAHRSREARDTLDTKGFTYGDQEMLRELLRKLASTFYID